MLFNARLSVESLECRELPATFGIPWHDPAQLSISFAPDGTRIAAHGSDLFAALGRTHATDAWQRTILEAFQKWAVHANLNFGVRLDTGAPLGAPGLVQFDPRFGDIRIGGNPMASEVLAIAAPPDPAISGTWAGDVLVNTAYVFDGNPYSLLAVAMHEAGHALGLDNVSDPQSVMYTRYDQMRTELSPGDVARIQALYGIRAQDVHEGSQGNETRKRATAIPRPAAYQGETPLVAFGDVTTAKDVDFFKFTLPSDGNNDDRTDRTVTIRLQSAGVSLLAPRLTILDASGQVLFRSVSRRFDGDVLQARLRDLTEGATYFVKVQAARSDAFSVGRYGLSVRFDDTSSISDQIIDKLLSGPFSRLDANAIDAFFRNSGDVLVSTEEIVDTPATAIELTAAAGYSGARFEAVGSISKSEDVDYYRVTAPAEGCVFTATAWTPDQTGFDPQIALFDSSGQRIEAQVLANGDGASTIQFADAVAGAAYFLRVSEGANATQDKGNYFVGVRFGEVVASVATFTTGTLSEANRSDGSRTYVGQASLFHFVLNAGMGDAGSSIRMTVANAAGETVFQVEARAGQAASRSSILLTPGAYDVTVEVLNPSEAPISYAIRGAILSDPTGPVTIDPTLNPQYVTPPPPNVTTAFAYPPGPISYDPSLLPGYVDPSDPSTYPPGWIPPPELLEYDWFLLSSDPYYWLALGY